MDDQSFDPDPPSQDEVYEAFEQKYYGVEHDAD